MRIVTAAGLLALVAGIGVGRADEQVFGYVRGAESLPRGASEIVQTLTLRTDKGQGTYEALDSKTEYERGITDRLTAGFALKMMAIETRGLLINAYIPKDEQYDLKPSGVEGELKYNFLSPAKDPIGLAALLSLDYAWLDPHSGQDKDTLSLELDLLAQKYFLDGQLIWVGNAGVESTYAHRDDVADLPPDFEWPTEPEMEIELKVGTGLSYRFAPNWFIGAEALYETEFETEVGQERWSVFAGPSLHYASGRWWATLAWFPQLEGGGEFYDGQSDRSLHLIEKTEQEIRVKLGYAF